MAMNALSVGRVSIRVLPDLDNFRKKVAAEVKNLEDAEVDVKARVGDLRREVKEKLSGMSAEVDVSADTDKVVAETEAAAKEASGKKVSLKPELKSADLQRQAVLAAAAASGREVKFRASLVQPHRSSFGRMLAADLSKFQRLKLGRDPRGPFSAVTRLLERGLASKAGALEARLKRVPVLLEAWADSGRKTRNELASTNDEIRKLFSEFENTTSKIAASTRGRLQKLNADYSKVVRTEKDIIRRSHKLHAEAGRSFNEGGFQASAFGRMFEFRKSRLSEDIRKLSAISEFAKEIDNLRRSAHEFNSERFAGLSKLADEADKLKRGRSFRGMLQELDQLRHKASLLHGEVHPFSFRRRPEPLMGRYVVPGRFRALRAMGRSFRGMAAQAVLSSVKASKAFAGLTGLVSSKAGGAARKVLSLGSASVVAARGPRLLAVGLSKLMELRRKYKASQPRKARFLGLTRIGWIVGAISALAVPLAQLVSGALSAVPALALSAGAALGVMVLGWDGIKSAAQQAAPALERAKQAVSGVFEERLGPQFAELGGVLDRAQDSLVKVANGMADFSQGAVQGLSSVEGFGYLDKALGSTARLFSKLSPFAEDFTVGLLGIAAAGSETFDDLSSGLNKWAKGFRGAVKRMSDSGEIQRGIKAAYDVLGSAGTNIGKIFGEALRTAPAMVEPVTRMFDGFADGVVKLIPLFSKFSDVVGKTLGTVFDEFGRLGEVWGPGLIKIMDELNPAIQRALQGVGKGLAGVGEVIISGLAKLAPFVGNIIGKVGDSLGRIGEYIANNPAIGHFLQRLGEVAGKLAETLIDVALPALEFFVQAVGKAMEVLGPVFDFVFDLIDKFSDGIKQISDEFKYQFHGILDELDAATQQSLEMYGNTAQRMMKYGFSFKNVFAIAEQDIRYGSSRLGRSLAGEIQAVADAANRAAAATHIDLSPIISKLDTVTSRAQLDQVRNELADYIRRVGEDANSVSPEVSIDPQVKLVEGANFSDSAAQMADSLKSSFEGVSETISSTVSSEMSLLPEAMSGSVEEAASALGAGFGEALGGVKIPTEGLASAITEALQGVSEAIGGQVDALGQVVKDRFTVSLQGLGEVLAGLPAQITPALESVRSSVGAAFDGLAEQARAALDRMVADCARAGEDSGRGLLDPVRSACDEALACIQNLVASAVEELGSLPGKAQAALGDCSGVLVASGAALVNGFIQGMRSKIPEVAAAASDVAGAARDFFPFSPAKKGPFSGRGYTTFSGAALCAGFAQGIRSGVAGVASAASNLVGAASRVLADPSRVFEPWERYHRGKILQPVLEKNAEALAKHREKLEAEHGRAVRSAKQMQAENRRLVAQDEELASRQARAVESMDAPELEVPDYSKIDRSFRAYFVEGTKGMLTDGLVGAVRQADLAGRIRGVALEAVAAGRRVFGSHPIFSQVEASVTAEHFADTLEDVIRESGIAEIPVNFAVANLSQLKQDLGMGDGVVSRVLDAAMSFNPNDTDSSRSRGSVTEVHYHVADIDEAMRLEQARERKELMRIR